MNRARRWILAALFLAPAPLSYLPGVPAHGFGHGLFLLPFLSLHANPALKGRIALFAAALLLQTLAFPKPDAGGLGFALLLPYLLARERADGGSWWRMALLFGFLRAHAGFLWLGDVHYTAWVGVSLAAALVFASVFEAGVRFARFLPYAFRVGVAWTAFEWVHSWFLGGLPWLFLGHTQHRFLAFAQAADIVGVHGLSFVMAFLQAAALQALRERRLLPLAAPAALLFAAIGYGAFRLSQEPPAAGPKVLLLQSALPVSVKEDRGDALERTFRTLVDLTDRGLREHPDAGLVVWPETLFPFPYVEDEPSRFDFQGVVASLAQRFRRPAIYGVNSFTTYERLRKRRGHNSAVLVRTDGTLGGIYRKQRLVPMGELFLPRLVFPERLCDAWIAALMDGPLRYPEQCDLEAGDAHVTLDAGAGIRCAVLICFEGLYPSMARAALEEGRPDLILHLANHGWFAGSAAQPQAKAIWVFRAIETRTPFVSCANSGVTCAVAPSGRPLGSLEDGSKPGLLAVSLPPRWPPPPLLDLGAWPLPAALLLACAGFLSRFWNGARRGRRPS